MRPQVMPAARDLSGSGAEKQRVHRFGAQRLDDHSNGGDSHREHRRPGGQHERVGSQVLGRRDDVGKGRTIGRIRDASGINCTVKSPYSQGAIPGLVDERTPNTTTDPSWTVASCG